MCLMYTHFGQKLVFHPHVSSPTVAWGGKWNFLTSDWKLISSTISKQRSSQHHQAIILCCHLLLKRHWWKKHQSFSIYVFKKDLWNDHYACSILSCTYLGHWTAASRQPAGSHMGWRCGERYPTARGKGRANTVNPAFSCNKTGSPREYIPKVKLNFWKQQHFTPCSRRRKDEIT